MFSPFNVGRLCILGSTSMPYSSNSSLDVTIQAQVMEMIQELIEKQKTSLILITHDLGLVATMCDNVAVVYAGKIIECSSC